MSLNGPHLTSLGPSIQLGEIIWHVFSTVPHFNQHAPSTVNPPSPQLAWTSIWPGPFAHMSLQWSPGSSPYLTSFALTAPNSKRLCSSTTGLHVSPCSLTQYFDSTSSTYYPEHLFKSLGQLFILDTFEALTRLFTTATVLTYCILKHSNHSWDWCCTHCIPFDHNSKWWFAPHCIPLQDFFYSRLNYDVHDKDLEWNANGVQNHHFGVVIKRNAVSAASVSTVIWMFRIQ